MRTDVQLPRAVYAKAPLLIGALLLAVGVVLLASAVITNVLRADDWERRSAHTTGIVVDITTSHTETRKSDGATRRETTYCPVVEFRVDGRTHTFEADTCTDPGPRIGERRAVRYDPANPADAMLDSWTARWLLVTILGGIGALFSGIGALVLLLVRLGKLPGHTEKTGSKSTGTLA